jgi:sialidase-1
MPRSRLARTTALLLFAAVTGHVAARGVAAEANGRVDVFSGGEGGYHTYRIPAIVSTDAGTLLAFCEGRKANGADAGDIDMVLRRSTDRGKTWGPLSVVHEEGDTAKITIGNPAPVVDRSTGAVWLPFCRDNDRVFVTHSDDDGHTWAEPVEITANVKRPDWDWYATGPGNGIQLTNGPHADRLVVPCDHRVGGDKTPWRAGGHSHVIYSNDHGATWQLGGVTGESMNECAVAELADGSLLLNMRSYRGKNRRGVARSSDGGLTWTEPVEDPALIEPVCQASMIRLLDDNGKSGPLLFSNPAGKSREKMTVRLSGDGGRSWPISRTVYAGSAAYSSLVELDDGSIGLLYERDGYSQITFERFTLDWLTADE